MVSVPSALHLHHREKVRGFGGWLLSTSKCFNKPITTDSRTFCFAIFSRWLAHMHHYIFILWEKILNFFSAEAVLGLTLDVTHTKMETCSFHCRHSSNRTTVSECKETVLGLIFVRTST